MPTPAEAAAQAPAEVAKRFYRPELDALRLFAFLAVFIVHGPRFTGPENWKQLYNEYAKAGGAGLCLFFFLSSYLITELLLRERERTGSIHLRSFYIRRILRIWPLYYLGVALAVWWGWRYDEYRLSGTQVAELVFLVGWMGKILKHNPLGILWSISVEELFYAMWPLLAKKRVILPASLLIIPISLAAAAYQANDDTWYNPIVHFLYFATGALLAILFHGVEWRCSLGLRGILFSICIALWVLAYSPFTLSWSMRYLLLDFGCLAVFLTFLQFPLQIPEPILYLGRISYGLYVFHNACLYVANAILVRWQVHTHVLRFWLLASIALGMTVALAALSYRFYETPFLKWKKRYEYIRTRSA